MLVIWVGDFDFVQVGQGFIYGFHIFLNDVFALAAVGVANGFANCLDRFVAGQNFGDGEKAYLQDRIHAAAHAGIARDTVGVDDEEAGLLGDELLLNGAGSLSQVSSTAEGAVEQERAAIRPAALSMS